MNEFYCCAGCGNPLRGILPLRIIPHGKPLDAPDRECLLLCTPECVRDWACKMMDLRDKARGIPARVDSETTEPREIPLPTTPCGVWSVAGEWCLKPRGHSGKHRYPNLSECDLWQSCTLLAGHTGSCV